MKFDRNGVYHFSLKACGFGERSAAHVYRFANAQAELPPHQHSSSFEICFLARGRQTYHVDQRYYEIKAGDCFLTFPDEIHSTGGFNQEKGMLYWLILPYTEKEDRGGEASSSDLLLDQCRQFKKRHFRGNSHFCFQIKKLMEEGFDGKTSLGRCRGRHAIEGILLSLIDSHDEDRTKALSAPIARCLEWIHHNEEESVPALARMAKLSTSRFFTRFKEETGFSPHDYLQRRKAERALEKLKRPGASVTEVAFEMGYSSSQYFSTIIKKYFRKNPRELLLSAMEVKKGI